MGTGWGTRKEETNMWGQGGPGPHPRLSVARCLEFSSAYPTNFSCIFIQSSRQTDGVSNMLQHASFIMLSV